MFKSFLLPYVWRTLEYQESNVPRLSELVAWVSWKISAHLAMLQHGMAWQKQSSFGYGWERSWVFIHWHSYTTSLINFSSMYQVVSQISMRFPWGFSGSRFEMQPSGSGDDVAAWWSVGQTWCLETGHMALHVPSWHKLWISEEICQRDLIWLYNFEKKWRYIDTDTSATFPFGATHIVCTAIMMHHVWW